MSPLMSIVSLLVHPIRVLAVASIWLASCLLAFALPIVLVSLAERACPPPEIDPEQCRAWVQAGLNWSAFLGGAVVGAAAMIVFPTMAAPSGRKLTTAKCSLMAGVVLVVLLLSAVPSPLLMLPAIAAVATGAACVWLVRAEGEQPNHSAGVDRHRQAAWPPHLKR